MIGLLEGIWWDGRKRGRCRLEDLRVEIWWARFYFDWQIDLKNIHIQCKFSNHWFEWHRFGDSKLSAMTWPVSEICFPKTLNQSEAQSQSQHCLFLNFMRFLNKMAGTALFSESEADIKSWSHLIWINLLMDWIGLDWIESGIEVDSRFNIHVSRVCFPLKSRLFFFIKVLEKM